MRALSQDVIEYLAAEALGTIGTDLFLAVEPDKPDEAITVYDTGGGPDLQSGDDYVQVPTVQIRSRGKDYREAWAKLHEIITKLAGDTVINVPNSSASYAGFWIVNGPMSIGKDEQERHMIVSNLRCIRSE